MAANARRARPAGWLTTVLAGAGLVTAVTVATWWLIGDLSESGMAPGTELDYLLQPFRLPAGVELAAGVGALLLVPVSGAALVSARRRRRFRAAWWSVLAALLVAGMLASLGWRLATAGAIGANIGIGLWVMFCGPVLLAALGYAGLTSWRLLDGGPPARPYDAGTADGAAGECLTRH